MESIAKFESQPKPKNLNRKITAKTNDKKLITKKVLLLYFLLQI